MTRSKGPLTPLITSQNEMTSRSESEYDRRNSKEATLLLDSENNPNTKPLQKKSNAKSGAVALVGGDISEYEKKRLENIAKRQEMLRALGLATFSETVSAPTVLEGPATKRKYTGSENTRSRARQRHSYGVSENQERRASSRLKGARPEYSTQDALDQIDYLEENLTRRRRHTLRSPIDKNSPSNEHEEEPDRETLLPRLVRTYVPDAQPLPNNTNVSRVICTPFSLASISTTVLELGEFVQDEESPKYWTTGNCKFHHPYPVGYHAKKVHFGREWVMRIVRGPKGEGPVFQVISDSGKVYEGPTPTFPWTQICIALAHKHGGTRISGPRFFGFSDPVVMNAIENLPHFEDIGGFKGGYRRKKR